MLGMLVTSLAFVLMGVLGLLIAAGAQDGPAQFMGVGLILFSWFFMVGYHGKRAEDQVRAKNEH